MSLDKNVVMNTIYNAGLITLGAVGTSLKINERRIGSYEFIARSFEISGCSWRRIDTRKIFTKKRIRSRRTLERPVIKI